MKLFFFVLVCFACFTSTVLANHKNCTTLDCSDMCNWHGMWVNTTTDSDGQHGYCVCDDMYYTLESDIPRDDDVNVGHHIDRESYYCIHRRKQQGTSFFLHILFGVFGASHFYMGHVGLGVAQLLLGILGGGSMVTTRTLGTGSGRTVRVVQSGSCIGFIWFIWYLVDIGLIVNGHYGDVHGESLYPM